MPKIKSRSLLLFTAFIWLIASIILGARALGWISDLTEAEWLAGSAIALVLAFIKTRLIFRKLTLKNIERIEQASVTHQSIWNFHSNRDKIIILLMIVLGMTLRRTPFIPTVALYPIYLGIGIAMFYVWLLYLNRFLNLKYNNR